MEKFSFTRDDSNCFDEMMLSCAEVKFKPAKIEWIDPASGLPVHHKAVPRFIGNFLIELILREAYLGFVLIE